MPQHLHVKASFQVCVIPPLPCAHTNDAQGCAPKKALGKRENAWQYGWKEEECDHMGGKKISETGSGADEVKGLPLH